MRYGLLIICLFAAGSSTASADPAQARCSLKQVLERLNPPDSPAMANWSEEMKTRHAAVVRNFEDQIIRKFEQMPEKVQRKVAESLGDVRINNSDFLDDQETRGFMSPKDLRIRLREKDSVGQLASLIFLGHEFDHVEFFARRQNKNILVRALDASYHPIDKIIRTEFLAHGFQYDVVQAMFDAAGGRANLFELLLHEAGLTGEDASDLATLLEVTQVSNKKVSLFTNIEEVTKRVSNPERVTSVIKSARLEELFEKSVQIMNKRIGIAMVAQVNSAPRTQFVVNQLWFNGYIKRHGVMAAIQFISVTVAAAYVLSEVLE